MIKSFSTTEEMEAYISQKIHGSFSVWDMKVLGMYTSKLKAGEQYLEVGVQYGKSSASAVFQSPEGIKFYFCDILDQPRPQPPYQNLLSREEFFITEGIDKVGTYILGDSKEIARTWDKGELAMIFIDGNHSNEAVKADIEGWYPHLKKGGFMLFHDYDITSFGAQQAIDELVKNDPVRFKDFFYAQETYNMRSSIAGAEKI